MEYSFNINIPSKLRDVKLRDWQKYINIYEKNKDNDSVEFLNLKMMQIFCGLSLEDSRKVPMSYFDSILSHLGDLFQENVDRVNQFTLIGLDNKEVTFGLIPNLDKMSYGEWVDLEEYIFSDKDLHKAMAVLYRPLAMGKGKDRYLIHPYNGTDEMAEIMKDTPVDIALGARVFFCRLAIKLGIYTQDYILQQLTQEEDNPLKMDLVKNGEYISQFKNWQEEGLIK